MMIKVMRSSESAVRKRATRRNIPETALNIVTAVMASNISRKIEIRPASKLQRFVCYFVVK
jgi:hypothetical protein